MELQGFMERQKIPSYFLNVTKEGASVFNSNQLSSYKLIKK